MSVLSTADPAFITKLTGIITANLGNAGFGAEELAQEAGLSRPRLNRRLLTIIGKTATQFILDTRLGISMQMLRSEDITAAEVAYKTGFSSPAYFNTCFHKHFGYPPGKVKVSEDKLQKDSIYVRGKRSAMRKYIYILSGVLILMASGYVIHFVRSGAPEKSIAVLPFRNLSSEITDQYIYDGIMDEIFNNLSKVHMLRVVSHNSVEQYRNTARATTDIARELNVNYIVEGSGQKVGNTFRLRVQLIKVRNKKEMHLWADSYEQDLLEIKNLFRIQNQIAQVIVAELKATLTPGEKEIIEKVPTLNIAAYDLYRKANGYRNDYEGTRDLSSYQTAVNLYNAALMIDSSFARVYTGLALIYWSRYYSDTFFKDDFMDSCLVLSEKALSLDKNLDEAYLLRGRYYREYGQFEKALDNFDRAIAINPNYSPAYIHKGALLAWIMNDYVSGIENLHRALNLVYGNDRPQVLYLLGNFYMNTGFLDKAEYFYREALKLTGDSARYFGDLVWIEFSREDFDEALKFDRMAYGFDSTYLSDFIICCIPPVTIQEAFRDAERILVEIEKSGRFKLQNSYRVGYAFLQAGKQMEAEHYINQQIKLSEEGIKLNRYIGQQKVAQYDLAAVYAFKGDREKAYQYLEEYSEKSYFRPPEISLTKHDPFFAGIRNEERFKKIVQKMETKYRAEHERVRKWLEEQRML